MPIKKVGKGYRWGEHGKVFPTRAGAERQMKAAFANGYKGRSEGGVVSEEGQKKKSSSSQTKKPLRKKPKAK